MRIEPLDFSDDDAATAYAEFVRAHFRDQWPDGLPAPVEHVVTRLRNLGRVHQVHIWLAWSGDDVVGTVEVEWWEAEDNRDRVYVYPTVAPHSEAVLDALFETVASFVTPLGRNVLMVGVPTGHPTGKWVEARGGRVGSTEQHNVLRLRSVDRAAVSALAAAPPDGYELLAFDGDCPDDLLEAYTRLMDTMNDAPKDDLTYEDWVYTPDRVRDYEAGLRARGHTMWTVLARSTSTGELAAFNQLAVFPEWPEVIENEDTAVAVPHRGHGLGLYVKAVNLLRAVDSDAEVVATWNAASNTHMLRVNRALGFVCEHEWDVWEMTV